MTAIQRKRLDLKQRYQTLESEAKELDDGLRSGKIGATAETKTRFEQCISEMEQIASSCDEIQRQTDEQDVHALSERLHDHAISMAQGVAPAALRAVAVSPRKAQSTRYSEMFHGAETRNAGGFNSVGEFMRAVAFSPNDPRLVPAHAMRASGMGEMIDSEGGFGVPPKFVARLIDAGFEDEIVRGADPGPENFPMTSGQKISVPGIDGADHSGPLLGGITVQHLAESATGTVEKAKLRLVTLEPKKTAIFAAASNELLADAPQFENQLLTKFGQAISFVLDEDFLAGDGAGKAQGVTHANNPALVVVEKEIGQAAATIIYENLANMLGRLHPSLWRGARWVIHPSCVPQLLLLSIPVGTGGSHVPVLREDGSGQLRMLGLPTFVSEKLQPLGTQADILLVNFRGYATAFRQGMQILRSAHHGFLTDEVYFRLTLRADGQSLWNAPITPAERNGHVELGDRARGEGVKGFVQSPP